jgi:hypothetical protein
MSRRSFFVLVVLLATFVLSPVMLGQAAAPAAKAKSGQKWTPKRTADGKPDLTGVWTNTTFTPLERPKELAGKQTLSEDEATKRENEVRVPAEVHYDYSQYGLDKTQANHARDNRTSLIVDPADGQIPPMLPVAQKRAADRAAKAKGHESDGPENRTLTERCLLMNQEAVPMLPAGYGNNFQIVQGRGYVVILHEMNHSARMIPTDGQPHLPPSVRQWRGDSRGHWEGETLVVDTTNFSDQSPFRGSSENLHVVERFTRLDEDTIHYKFTVYDPETWAQPWSAELYVAKLEGGVFEYACNEGNYGLSNILSGARAMEKKAAESAR